MTIYQNYQRKTSFLSFILVRKKFYKNIVCCHNSKKMKNEKYYIDETIPKWNRKIAINRGQSRNT